MSIAGNLSRPRFLESERLFLTPQVLDDLENNFRWENDRQLCLMDGGRFRPKSLGEVKNELKARMNHKSNRYYSIILKTGGEHIGNLGLFDISVYHRRCRWGIRLGRDYHRRGYGRETGRLIISYVFEKMEMRRLMSGTHSQNKASMKYQESLGFEIEGRLRENRRVDGRFVDDILYGMTRKDYEKHFGR